MASTASIWFTDNALLVRMDLTDAGPRWSSTAAYARRFRAQRLVGGAVRGALQTGPDELVFVGGGSIDLVSGNLVAVGLRWRSLAIVNEERLRQIPRQPTFDYACTTIGPPPRLLYTTIDDEDLFLDPFGDEIEMVPGGLTFANRTSGASERIASGTVVCLPGDRLHSFASDGTYQVYDLPSRTTDGIRRPLADGFAPLTALDRVAAAWIAHGDVDRWTQASRTADLTGDVVRIIRGVAADTQVQRLGLALAVLALSGGRVDAYHPAGRYGLLALDAEKLAAAGWDEVPAAFLGAPADRQHAVLARHVASCAVTSEVSVLAGLLTPGESRSDWTEATVIAAPGGPRAELLTSFRTADVDRDGRITVKDLDEFVQARYNVSYVEELERRFKFD